MDNSRNGLPRGISLLRSKIRTNEDVARQEDELSVKNFLAFQKMRRRRRREDWVDIKNECLKYSLRFRRDLGDTEFKFLPTATDFLKLSSPAHNPRDG